MYRKCERSCTLICRLPSRETNPVYPRSCLRHLPCLPGSWCADPVWRRSPTVHCRALHAGSSANNMSRSYSYDTHQRLAPFRRHSRAPQTASERGWGTAISLPRRASILARLGPLFRSPLIISLYVLMLMLPYLAKCFYLVNKAKFHPGFRTSRLLGRALAGRIREAPSSV